MKKSFIESKNFTILLHVLVWSTVLILQIVSFQLSAIERPPRVEEFGANRFYHRFIFHAIMMISVYYLNTLVLIPRLLFKNKVVQFFIALILIVVFFILLDMLLGDLFEYRRKIFGKTPPVTFLISVFIIALSTSIKLAQKWFENESKQKAMIHEKTNAELSLLKTQINPHFLFNTLNGIYSLANEKSDKTAPAIVKLSQLMRYMLDESKQDFVSLSSELDYIKTFIDLQQFRLFDNVKVEFNIKGEANDLRIQPLLLIPFIENAFKHGTNSTSDCLINIDLDIKLNSIQLIVKNDIIKARNEDEKSGFGLKNIKRRLELEYPDRYVLKTECVENKFIVELYISIR
jgi:two-component system LytT family sensor kinase